MCGKIGEIYIKIHIIIKFTIIIRKQIIKFIITSIGEDVYY